MKRKAETNLGWIRAGCTLLALVIGMSLMAQRSEPIPRMGHTNTRLFDEGWKFDRYGPQPDGTLLEEPRGVEMPDFDDRLWRRVDLPHDWAVEGPFRIDLPGETGKLPYKGIGWYRKSFALQASDIGRRIYIDFDGAMANAQIWLNGQYVGTWPYGYSSFRLDLTPFVKYSGMNLLAVRLDTEKWDSRWYPGAGIYRHVWLVKSGQVHVGHWGTFITTPEVTSASAVVRLDLTLHNEGEAPADANVRTTIFELDELNIQGRRVAAFDETVLNLAPGSVLTETFLTRIADPKWWDINSPNRYVAQTTIRVNGLISDSYLTPFGIRTFEITPRDGFLLNGRKVYIQGTCNHHDLGALGAAINTSALRRQLTLLKAMGCNSLRTSHNPPAPELLELADQMGFLVMNEAFDTWKKGKKPQDYHLLFDEWHEKDLRALIRRDRNHPSVIFWSIGNEVMDQQDVELTRQLADIVRSEDPTRLVTNGYNDPDRSREAGSPLALDLMGVNYFFAQQPKWDSDPRYQNMPTIGTETSSCVSSRGEYFIGELYKNWQISSYDQAHPAWGCTPDEQFRTNHQLPHLLGEYVWTGFDYLGEPTPYNSDETNLLNYRNDPSKKAELEKKLNELKANTPPSRSSYFGIIDLAGFPKDRYYLYQSQWRPDLPMVHILPHWNWDEKLRPLLPVHVYTSGDEAELFVNGKSLGRKAKRPGQDFRLVWDSVKYEPGKVDVVAYRNGQKWAEKSIKTTGKATRLVLVPDKRVINPGQSELAFITLQVVDREGQVVPGAKPPIRFEIEGPGQIVATDNGDPTCLVPFRSLEREAFNGLALAIVKGRKGAPGRITVRAHSKGLQSAAISIELQQKIKLNE
ncbi:MAG: beta-galactosidase GalB [Bacteroidales bacterium]